MNINKGVYEMKNKSILSQPQLRERREWIAEDREEKNSPPIKNRTHSLNSSDVYSMLHLSSDVEDAIVKEMIAYACVIADGSENLFPVRFSDINGKKVLIISRNFDNPMEVEELLSVSYAAYLSPEA